MDKQEENKNSVAPVAKPVVAAVPKSKPLTMLRKPVFGMGNGVERTLASITPGSIDPELEASKRMLGIMDEVVPEVAASREAVETLSVLDLVPSVTESVPSPAHSIPAPQPKPPKEAKSKSEPSVGNRPSSSSSGEYAYNLKVDLVPEEAEKLEALCLKIRFEIRQKKNRKQLIGLQTLAQHLFDKMLRDEKFRSEIHKEMVDSIMITSNSSTKK